MKKVVAFSIIALELVICHALIFEMPGFAQARQSLSSMRVIYNTQKATVRPQGALKEKIDALDREIAEAQRLGRTGAMRGLFAKGIALLAGREWTDELEFPTSLVVRSEQVCVDSNIPYAVRLEQSQTPRGEFTAPLSVRVSLLGSGRGAWFNIDEVNSNQLWPWNGRVPETISYIVTPNAQMSLQPSILSPRSCSGDM